MNRETVEVITTGGTLDKQYNPQTGQLAFNESFVPEILQKGRSTVPTRITHLMAIDSLEMDDTHRETLLAHCKQSHCRSLLITHGTDTMEDTARFLEKAELDKTIVLTGAMIPYSISASDAQFNLGTAFTSVQLLGPGVYIVMNGRVFDAANVTKNRDAGEFETKS